MTTTLPTLLALSLGVTLLAALFVFVSLLMTLVVLIQKPKGGGLSGAFGGGGNSENAFMGAKAGDFLTILTVGCFVVFLVTAMGLTWLSRPATANPAPASVTTPAPQGMGAGPTDTDGDGDPDVPASDLTDIAPLPTDTPEAPADPAPLFTPTE